MTWTNALPRLGVLHDFGALSTLEIIESATGLCDLVWITRAGDEVDDLLAMSGDVATCAYDFWAKDVDPVGIPRLDAVIAFSDRTLGVANSIATAQSLIAHQVHCLEAFTDKSVQRAVLREHGLRQPRTARPATADEAKRALAELGGGPVVVKPISSYGSRNTFRVDTAQDIDQMDRHGEFDWSSHLIEEFLRAAPATCLTVAHYVCVESVVSDGDVINLAISGKFRLKEPFLEMGCFTGAQLGADATAVADEVTKALRALDVRDGVCHTEVMLCAEGPRIIEVNGRVGGWVRWLLKRSTGMDIGKLALMTALGRPVDGLIDSWRKASPLVVADVGPVAIPAGAHAFIFRDPPGPGGSTVAGVPDVDRLKSLPGVERVDVFAAVGDRMDWLDLGTPHATAVWGVVETYPELLDLAVTLFEEATVAWKP